MLEGAAIESADLSLERAKLNPSSTNRTNGRMRLKVIINDTANQTFEANLLDNSVTMRVTDGAFWSTPISFKGCKTKREGVFRCKSSSNPNARATFKRLKGDPDIYAATILVRKIPNIQTASVRPVPPITATLNQTPSIARSGNLARCVSRGRKNLSCKAL